MFAIVRLKALTMHVKICNGWVRSDIAINYQLMAINLLKGFSSGREFPQKSVATLILDLEIKAALFGSNKMVRFILMT